MCAVKGFAKQFVQEILIVGALHIALRIGSGILGSNLYDAHVHRNRAGGEAAGCAMLVQGIGHLAQRALGIAQIQLQAKGFTETVEGAGAAGRGIVGVLFIQHGGLQGSLRTAVGGEESHALAFKGFHLLRHIGLDEAEHRVKAVRSRIGHVHFHDLNAKFLCCSLDAVQASGYSFQRQMAREGVVHEHINAPLLALVHDRARLRGFIGKHHDIRHCAHIADVVMRHAGDQQHVIAVFRHLHKTVQRAGHGLLHDDGLHRRILRKGNDLGSRGFRSLDKVVGIGFYDHIILAVDTLRHVCSRVFLFTLRGAAGENGDLSASFSAEVHEGKLNGVYVIKFVVGNVCAIKGFAKQLVQEILIVGALHMALRIGSGILGSDLHDTHVHRNRAGGEAVGSAVLVQGIGDCAQRALGIAQIQLQAKGFTETVEGAGTAGRGIVGVLFIQHGGLQGSLRTAVGGEESHALAFKGFHLLRHIGLDEAEHRVKAVRSRIGHVHFHDLNAKFLCCSLDAVQASGYSFQRQMAREGVVHEHINAPLLALVHDRARLRGFIGKHHDIRHCAHIADVVMRHAGDQQHVIAVFRHLHKTVQRAGHGLLHDDGLHRRILRKGNDLGSRGFRSLDKVVGIGFYDHMIFAVGSLRHVCSRVFLFTLCGAAGENGHLPVRISHYIDRDFLVKAIVADPLCSGDGELAGLHRADQYSFITVSRDHPVHFSRFVKALIDPGIGHDGCILGNIALAKADFIEHENQLVANADFKAIGRFKFGGQAFGHLLHMQGQLLLQHLTGGQFGGDHIGGFAGSPNILQVIVHAKGVVPVSGFFNDRSCGGLFIRILLLDGPFDALIFEHVVVMYEGVAEPDIVAAHIHRIHRMPQLHVLVAVHAVANDHAEGAGELVGVDQGGHGQLITSFAVEVHGEAAVFLVFPYILIMEHAVDIPVLIV